MAQYSESPKLNALLFSFYGAALVDYSVGPVLTSDGYFASANNYKPVTTKRSYGIREITMTCEFVGENLHDTTLSISQFTEAMQGDCTIVLPDRFTYFCQLVEASAPTIIANFIQVVSYKFVGYRRSSMWSETFTKTGSIYIDGTLPAEVRYTITPSSSTVTVAGITVTGCSTGKTLVIDGIDKVITHGGTNCFARSDLTSFPRLNPGSNTISISGASRVVVEYYPAWL